MLPTKFQFIWASSFRGEDFQKLTIQKKEFPVAAMFVNGSKLNEQSLQKTYRLPTKFRFIWASSFRGEDLKKNDPSETTIAYGGHNFSELRQIEQSLQRTFYPCCLPSFIHLVKRFQKRSFVQKSTNQKQDLHEVAMFVNGSG